MKNYKVYTGGCFDLFHWGHVNFLRQCSLLGPVTVGLNTDDFVYSRKKKFPVIDYTGRKKVLEACKYVSAVVRSPGDNQRPVLLKLKPKYLAIGSDWKGKYLEQANLTEEWLKKHEITLIYIPYTKGISTTKIRLCLD